ncbi:MAG TPA: hypothetical protein VK453_27270 [Micromonosporaceae bacterium]|nr:hypothetical protein [Micromonosporaceae bacterium]
MTDAAEGDDVVPAWIVDLDIDCTNLIAELDPAEAVRLAAIPIPQATRQYVTAHMAVRRIAAGSCNVHPHRLRWVHGPNASRRSASPVPVRTSA